MEGPRWAGLRALGGRVSTRKGRGNGLPNQDGHQQRMPKGPGCLCRAPSLLRSHLRTLKAHCSLPLAVLRLVLVLVTQSCPTLCNAMDYSPPGSSVYGISQEYWSGLSLLPPGDLSNPGNKPEAPALQADSLPLSHQGSATEVI